jgi:hypothetical protein
MEQDTELSKHRRLAVLIVLKEMPEYMANDSVLTDKLYMAGLPTARSIVVATMEWLRDHELITLQSYADLKVAQLTDRGLDVAYGRIVVEGVKKPRARRPGQG